MGAAPVIQVTAVVTVFFWGRSVVVVSLVLDQMGAAPVIQVTAVVTVFV